MGARTNMSNSNTTEGEQGPAATKRQSWKTRFSPRQRRDSVEDLQDTRKPDTNEEQGASLSSSRLKMKKNWKGGFRNLLPVTNNKERDGSPSPSNPQTPLSVGVSANSAKNGMITHSQRKQQLKERDGFCRRVDQYDGQVLVVDGKLFFVESRIACSSLWANFHAYDRQTRIRDWELPRGRSCGRCL